MNEEEAKARVDTELEQIRELMMRSTKLLLAMTVSEQAEKQNTLMPTKATVRTALNEKLDNLHQAMLKDGMAMFDASQTLIYETLKRQHGEKNSGS